MTRAHWVAAGAVCVCAHFFFFTSDGINGGFTHDDLMNLYRAWKYTWWDHLRDIVCFWRVSDLYRPAGSLFYRAVHTLFGLDPLPYRLACHVIIAINLVLAGAVARRLSGSAEAGLLAPLLLSVHGQLWPLYTSTGFIYDLLAVSFFCTALLAYLNGRPALALAAYVLCMNSKEVAVSWPVVVLAWELLTRPPRRWNWPLQEGRVALIAGAMTAAFIVGRVQGPGSLAEMDAYRPAIGWGAFTAHAYHWTWLTFYESKWLTPGIAAALAAAFGVGALASRSRPLMLACVWAPAAVLPVAFITQRGLESISIALVAVAMYLAVAIREITRLMARAPDRWDSLRAAAVFALLLVLLGRIHARHWRSGLDPFLADGRHIEHVKRRTAEIRPLLRGVTHVLMLTDPYPKHEWGSLFTIKLVAGDDSIQIHRADRLHATWDEPLSPGFDLVFRWENGGFVRCEPGPFRRVAPDRLVASACAAPPAPVAARSDYR